MANTDFLREMGKCFLNINFINFFIKNSKFEN